MASRSPSEANDQSAAGQNVELENLDDKQPSVPLEEDIMQLARLGEIAAIQKLFDGGQYDATYKDEQGITPLHVGLPFYKRKQLLGNKMSCTWTEY